MTQANVELFHQAYDAVNRRDLGWWENVFDVFPDFTTEAVEVRDLGYTTEGDALEAVGLRV